MNIRGSMLIMLVTGIAAHAVSSEPYNLSFNTWNKIYGPEIPKLRREFKKDYSKELDRQKERLESPKAHMQRAFHRKFEETRALGMRRLELVNPKIFVDVAKKLVSPHLSKAGTKSVERLLMREGNLSKFYEKKRRSSTTIASKIKKASIKAWNATRNGVANFVNGPKKKISGYGKGKKKSAKATACKIDVKAAECKTTT